MCGARERYSVKLRMHVNNPSAKSWPSLIEKRSSGITSIPPNVQGQCWMGSSSSQNTKSDTKAPISSQIHQRKDVCSGSDSQHVTQSGVALARKRRVHAQVSILPFDFSIKPC